MTRAETNRSALLVLVGSLLFFVLFLLAAAGKSEAAESYGSKEVTTRTIRGDHGGWLRSGPFTLVFRAGALSGDVDVTLEHGPAGRRCTISPSDLIVDGAVLRIESKDTAGQVYFRPVGSPNWMRAEVKVFPKRGYVEVPVRRFGEFEVRPH